MRALLRVALLLAGLELALVIVGGGVGVTGRVGAAGFFLRLGLLGLTVVASHRLAPAPRPVTLTGYLGILILLLPLLYFRGYRLRGDGLWYYSYTHSLAFDGDIDLANDYAGLGIERFRGSETVGATGRARFTFPVGAPIAWVPFIGLGHAGAWLRNLHGIDTPYDGFSDPYLHAVALANLLVGWLGLVVLDRLCRRWFAPGVAFAATVAVGLGSFLLWYLVYQPVYTHALTFALAAVYLLRWSHHREKVADFAILGLLAGVAALVRWQNALFGLLLVWSLGEKLLARKGRLVLASAAAAGAGFLLGVLPQLLTWRLIFGRFFIGVPLGSEYMRWWDPFLMETLFASRHGLFSWSPVLIPAVIGLVGFARREPRAGWPLVGLVVVQTYVNSAVADWWGGGGFGARRFDAVVPILALGLATTLEWLTAAARRRPERVTAGALLLVVVTNVLFMEQYRKGRIPTDDTISWEVAARGMLEDVFDGVGYPFSFPANWIFSLKYHRPKTQYDLLVGKYLFHRQNNLGGVIDLGVHDPPFIGNGWSGVKDWEGRAKQIRLALGPRAGLLVPTDRAEPLRIGIVCAVPPGMTPRPVEVRLNGYRLGTFLPTPVLEEHRFFAGSRWWKRINLLELTPASEDGRGQPYLAVDRFRFERFTPSDGSE